MNGSNVESNNKNSSFLRDQLLTRGDLECFKNELFEELRDLLKGKSEMATKPWLRSSEVRKLLGVSSGTLQNLRINGTLSYSKVGGIVYYRYDDLIKILESNQISGRK